MSVVISRPRAKPHLGARLDMQHPLSRGLMGCWLFNESGGAKLWDISGSANHGVLTNMDPSSDWVSSPGGISLDFDGTDDCIVLPKPTLYATVEEITISSSVVPAASASGTIFRVSSSTANSQQLSKYELRVTTSTIVFIASDGTTIDADTISSLSIPAGIRSSVVVTLGPTGSKDFYLNGSLVGTATKDVGPFVGTLVNNTIATNRNAAGQNFWDGRIDRVATHNRALSASEIRWLYTEPYCNIVQPQYRTYFFQSSPPTTAVKDIIGLDIIPWAR